MQQVLAEIGVCVLSSSSSGNCSLLSVRRGGHVTTILIDAGLSPRRTRRHLAEVGHPVATIDHVILTHLDRDHWCDGWINGRDRHTTIHVHKRHAGLASRLGVTAGRTELFSDTFELLPGLMVHPILVAHDSTGTAAFRFECTASGRSLGYATDTGRPSQELCEHLRGVDVLAIESNYCPEMQLASNRPDHLKQRIMGGKGHLSNEESARAVARIAPREAVVLLHLSRQCNRPERALEVHGAPGPRVMVSHHDRPCEWIRVVDPARHVASPEVKVVRPASTLWGA